MTDQTATELLSPLHAEHLALGATMTPFGGWQMPLRYTSDLAEHRAVRGAAGLFDLSHMGEIVVAGPQASAALDYALVGQASSIGVAPAQAPGERPSSGRARYSLLCAEDGGVLDDLIVYRTGDAEFMVVANAANAGLVFAELTARAAGFDATVRDETTETALVAVQGPRAEGIVAELLARDHRSALSELRYYAWRRFALHCGGSDHDVLVARTGYTGEDGFELFLPVARAAALWRDLLSAGEPHGMVPCGLASRDSLRLEAGMPLYGHELTPARTPYDAGFGRVVRLDKAAADGSPLPFVGRDALTQRSQSPDEVRLVGLRGEGRRAARPGCVVYPAGGEPGDASGDEPIGEITSGQLSPTLGYPVAMAFVAPERSAPGTALEVDVRGRRERMVVVELPFYRRPQ